MVAQKSLMQFLFIFLYLLLFSNSAISQETSASATKVAASPETALSDIKSIAERIDYSIIREAATHQNGRVKPFDTLARELILYLNGRYSRWGLHPTQLYLALVISQSSPWLEIIELRDPELRKQLGYLETKRFFSLAELESSPLAKMAQPLFQKQQQNQRSLSESEKKVLESYDQMAILQQIISGEHFFQTLDFSNLLSSEERSIENSEKIKSTVTEYFRAISEGKSEQAQTAALKLVEITKIQKTPELFAHYVKSLKMEVFYNDAKLFFWAAILYLILGSLLLWPKFQQKVSHTIIICGFLIPLFLQVIALGIRVYITEFAPVTNMYGTMIWVALGVNLFSLILFSLYRNRYISGFLLITSGLILWLTESIPLILSPDLDPLVAVLRNNFWLSTHVTTITISYAAFTIAMVLGNVALIRLWTHKENAAFFKEYSHYCYRMIQLGVFLITVGIILGGVWADYSWGRFWGWDPKETWALIADLGFIVLLHARYIKWVNDFTLLAFSPVAYLLVIMAWYGVNFILAAGLHSYGFSSGGATMVGIFIVLQITLLLASLIKFYNRRTV